MTISILGCGWLGLPLGEHLARRGHRVKGSTTASAKLGALAEAGIEPYLLRLGDDDPGTEPGPAASDFFDADALYLNVPPGRRRPDVEARYRAWMAQVAAMLARSPVRLVVFASSTSVYPDLGREVTEEDADVAEPESASGRVLREAERLFLEAPGYDAVVLRFAGLYGYDRRPGRFLAGRTGLAGGDAPVNLVHRDDCVAVSAAVVERGVRGEVVDQVFNVCADEHPSRRRLYTQAAARMGLEPPVFSDAPFGFKIVSNRRLKEHLGYTFLHPDPLRDAP